MIIWNGYKEKNNHIKDHLSNNNNNKQQIIYNGSIAQISSSINENITNTLNTENSLVGTLHSVSPKYENRLNALNKLSLNSQSNTPTNKKVYYNNKQIKINNSLKLAILDNSEQSQQNQLLNYNKNNNIKIIKQIKLKNSCNTLNIKNSEEFIQCENLKDNQMNYEKNIIEDYNNSSTNQNGLPINKMMSADNI